MRSALMQKVPLALLIAWCAVMSLVRLWYSHSHVYDFLPYNLALAGIPLIAALVLRLLPRRGFLVPVKLVLFLAWLAFLPNAPYLVTDLVHLRDVAPVPFWFDIALFVSYAATGALLGYSSVADVESVVSRSAGRSAGFVVACSALLLCGFGIYLGRFLRWNSWDLLAAPRTLLGQIVRLLAHPLSHPGPWEVSIVYGVGLVLGYLTLRSMALAPAAPHRGPTSASSRRRELEWSRRA